MAKRQNFVVGSTNPVTVTKTQAELNNGWNKYQVLKSGDLDGVFNAVSDYSNDSSNEIANAIQALTGAQPTGASQNELASALQQMREDIETSSLTFKGYVATTAPSSSTYGLVEGNIWINASAMPTTFPVAIAGVWNGTSWATTTDTYTVQDFDFFRNINDGEGYYWFGGQWVVMSTDMSTTYFTLNQTSGKWEIKDSVNLPGAPTVATPTSASPQTQIANKKYVDENISAITSDFDIFDTKWRDATTNNTRWLLSDGNWKTNTKGYQHLADDLGTIINFYCWEEHDSSALYYVTKSSPTAGDSVYNSSREIVGTVTSVSGNYLYFNWTGGGSETLQRYSDADYIYMSDATEHTETIAGTTITYYLAEDGHKICLPDQESNVTAIYNATGVAWYYIIDTTNQQFKLPRTKFGFTGLRDTVGNYVAAGLPDHNHTVGIPINGGWSGTIYIGGSDQNTVQTTKTFTSSNASASNSIYGNSTTVQPPATQMYLYFYVGLVAQE